MRVSASQASMKSGAGRATTRGGRTPMRFNALVGPLPASLRPAAQKAVAPRPSVQRIQTHLKVASSENAVQQRWESQIRDGRVRNISASDVNAMQAEGWVVLDVRPPTESTKSQIDGAVQVPLYIPDTATDAVAFIKKATDFAMGSWWLGGTHYVPNAAFMSEVQSKVPQDARVIVACQKGLRSLAACEQLAKSGYQQLAWVNGGLDTARKGDIKTVGGVDIRYAGIGGLSEAIGWTEVQREDQKSSFMGGLDGVIKLFAAVLIGDLLLFAYEQVNYWQTTGTGPFGN